MEHVETNVTLIRSLQTRLIVSFLVVSLVPLVVVGWLTFTQSEAALQRQVSNQLSDVRDLKAERLEAFFQLVSEDIVLLAQFPVIAQATQELATAADELYGVRLLGYLNKSTLTDSGNNTVYDAIHARYHPIFHTIVETKGYGDIYLITPTGDVIYNFDKGDDFATNLRTGSYRQTHLANLFRELATNSAPGTIKISDFVPYSPSGGVPAGFIGTPIMANGEHIGVLIFQLPLARINDVMQSQAEVIGQTGEIYLVGADKLMRSDSRLSQENTILKQTVDTPAIRQALEGQTGLEVVTSYRGPAVLSAYQPLKFGDRTWALVAEVNENEALALANRLRNVSLTALGLSILVVAGLGLLIARSITRPITNLTRVAIAISGGNLSRMASVESNDEIGLLAHAFNSLTRQLQELINNLQAQVAERTAQLEEQVNQLATLNRLTQTVVAEPDLTKALDMVAQEMTQLFQALSTALALLDKQQTELTIVSSYSRRADLPSTVGVVIPLTNNISSLQVIESAQSAIVSQAQTNPITEPIHELLRQRYIHALMLIPLRTRGEVIGTIGITTDDPTRDFTEAELRLAETIAGQIAGAIDNARLLLEERQAKEAAEASDRAKSAFLANVSHELRTPLTSILGFAKMISKRLDDRILPLVPLTDRKVKRATKQITQNIGIIISEGERLTTLINDVLDLAKIEADKMTWHKQSLQVREIIEQASAATSALFIQKSLQLHQEIEEALPLIIGDSDRLIQVLINLLSNAVKFTATGSITCRAEQIDHEIIISVIDTGIGIAEADQAKVFAKFEQVGDTLTDKPEGTGLGLPICQEIVKRHGGRIWLESQPGQGSTFSFSLPIPE